MSSSLGITDAVNAAVNTVEMASQYAANWAYDSAISVSAEAYSSYTYGVNFAYNNPGKTVMTLGATVGTTYAAPWIAPDALKATCVSLVFNYAFQYLPQYSVLLDVVKDAAKDTTTIDMPIYIALEVKKDPLLLLAAFTGYVIRKSMNKLSEFLYSEGQITKEGEKLLNVVGGIIGGGVKYGIGQSLGDVTNEIGGILGFIRTNTQGNPYQTQIIKVAQMGQGALNGALYEMFSEGIVSNIKNSEYVQLFVKTGIVEGGIDAVVFRGIGKYETTIAVPILLTIFIAEGEIIKATKSFSKKASSSCSANYMIFLNVEKCYEDMRDIDPSKDDMHLLEDSREVQTDFIINLNE